MLSPGQKRVIEQAKFTYFPVKHLKNKKQFKIKEKNK